MYASGLKFAGSPVGALASGISSSHLDWQSQVAGLGT